MTHSHIVVSTHRNPHQQDADGATALMIAAYKGHIEKVQLLLQAGADVMAQDKLGRTALHWTAEGLSNAETVSALLAAAKDSNKLAATKDKYGVRAATRARVRGEKSLAKLMEKA